VTAHRPGIVPALAESGFRPVVARRAFEEVLDQLEAAITSGKLSAGDRLPPERDLALQFEVSRTSVREAVRVLEALGLAKVQRGAEQGGVWLLEQPGNAFTHLLRLYLSLQHASIRDVVDFLVVTSAWAARTAAGDDGDPEALTHLAQIVERMGAADVDPEAWYELDAAFHATIVRAGGNAVAIMILEGLNDSLKRLIYSGVSGRGDWPSTRGELSAEHQAIFAAIQAKNADLASDLMATHLTVWCERAIEAEAARGAPPGI
jgi:GntR family transcriptional repressor for pyruvate dehydrogenase complex